VAGTRIQINFIANSMPDLPNWADRAPALVGLPSFTEQQVEHVLENGTGPNGEELHPPMHLPHEPRRCEAIAAYLKSLPQGQSTE
jgi:hypothetical protein